MTFQSALGRKLQRLGTLPGSDPRPAAPAPAAPPAPASTPPSALGVPEPTAHGVLNVTLRRYAAEHRHGRIRIGSALAAQPEHVAALALDPSLAGAAPERALLLDTETTGLAGGAGTLPFLIGLGWFDPSGALHLEQLFLARPGEERPMLARLAERLSTASCIVSFNGKSYDWPLLRTRFVMNRMPVPTPPPHLDLLHCARRAFRYRCQSARLVELEAEVVGHVRHGDIPGHLIPQLYFAYLRSRGGGALRRVMDHNAQDLLMLAALLGHLSERFAAPAEGVDCRDALGLAEVAFRVRDHERADAFAALAAGSSRPDLASAALVIRARVRWRARDVAGAVAWLERAVALAPRPLAPRLHLALAKLHEHRLRDFQRALQHAAQAAGAEPPAKAERRLQRLREKQERAGREAVTTPSGRPGRSAAPNPG